MALNLMPVGDDEGFGPKGIAAWNQMLFNMDKNRAERPYIADTARVNYETKQSESDTKRAEADNAQEYYKGRASGETVNNAYKMAMADYLQNPNMKLKGYTNPTKELLEQGLANAPGGLTNLVSPPGRNSGGLAGYPPQQQMPQQQGGLGGQAMNGPMGTPQPPSHAMQDLPLSPQQIERLKRINQSQQNSGAPAGVKLGMQNGELASNQEVLQQTGGNHSLDDVNNVYNRDITNKTTDKLLQKRIDYAQHLETTLDQIDPEIFKVYSGPQGKIKYARDYAASLTGNVTPEFEKYQAMQKVTAPLFAGELRQFQGDSVREGVRELFESLANPATWTNPEVAAYQYKMLRTILGSELTNDLNMAEHGPDYDKMRARAKEDILIRPVKEGGGEIEKGAPAAAANDISSMSLDQLKAMRAKMGA